MDRGFGIRTLRARWGFRIPGTAGPESPQRSGRSFASDLAGDPRLAATQNCGRQLARRVAQRRWNRVPQGGPDLVDRARPIGWPATPDRGARERRGTAVVA